MDDLRPILPSVDFFLPNADEGRHLTGEQNPERQAAIFNEAGVKTVVITIGAEGLLVRTANDTCHVPAPSVDVVDRSGAGDAFAAGLIIGLQEGWALQRTLVFASATGALACTALGCSAGIPNREHVMQQVATH